MYVRQYHLCKIFSKKRMILIDWRWVVHTCIGYLTIIGSYSGFLPSLHQVIIWTNAGILLIWPLGTNFSEILIRIHTFSFKKMHIKMLYAKWCPLSPCLDVFNNYNYICSVYCCFVSVLKNIQFKLHWQWNIAYPLPNPIYDPRVWSYTGYIYIYTQLSFDSNGACIRPVYCLLVAIDASQYCCLLDYISPEQHYETNSKESKYEKGCHHDIISADR